MKNFLGLSLLHFIEVSSNLFQNVVVLTSRKKRLLVILIMYKKVCSCEINVYIYISLPIKSKKIKFMLDVSLLIVFQ